MSGGWILHDLLIRLRLVLFDHQYKMPFLGNDLIHDACLCPDCVRCNRASMNIQKL